MPHGAQNSPESLSQIPRAFAAQLNQLHYLLVDMRQIMIASATWLNTHHEHIIHQIIKWFKALDGGLRVDDNAGLTTRVTDLINHCHGVASSVGWT